MIPYGKQHPIVLRWIPCLCYPNSRLTRYHSTSVSVFFLVSFVSILSSSISLINPSCFYQRYCECSIHLSGMLICFVIERKRVFTLVMFVDCVNVLSGRDECIEEDAGRSSEGTSETGRHAAAARKRTGQHWMHHRRFLTLLRHETIDGSTIQCRPNTRHTVTLPSPLPTMISSSLLLVHERFALNCYLMSS